MNTFLVFLTFALWSASFPFGKIALHGASPAFITGTRMLLAGILLFILHLLQKRKSSIKKESMALSIPSFNLRCIPNKYFRIMGS